MGRSADGSSINIISKTLMARTRIACLVRLFRTHLMQIWDNLERFSFLVLITRRGDSNENTQYTIMLKKIEKLSFLCLLTRWYD